MVPDQKKPSYCFDTSSLVQAWTRSYPFDVFPTFWDKMEELVEQGRIVVPDEVERETSRRDDGLQKWIKDKDGLVWKIDEELQESVKEILSDFQFMVKNRPGKNAADPWVVALARITKRIVVTEEIEDDASKNPKIPMVCKHYGIEFKRLLDVIRIEGWKF